MALRIGLFVAAALLLGAHFLRQGNLVLVALCLCAPLLLVYRKRWVLLVLRLLAYGAAVTWIVVAVRLVELRLQSGQPWQLAAIILGAVALFTLIAGLLLNSQVARERYPP
jgi:CDP-diglyceride synthetase